MDMAEDRDKQEVGAGVSIGQQYGLKSEGNGEMVPSRQYGGVFISHVHEDAQLAKAFADLVHDVSSGLISTFSSSALEVGKGIKYGEQWFASICGNIETSHRVVALITPASVGRPWVLFEAGLGLATRGCKVFGVSFGVSASKAYAGPFGVLQNSGSDQEELVKLCKELIQDTPLQPRDESITQFVKTFTSAAEACLGKEVSVDETPDDAQIVAVFNALEEMRQMFREVGRVREASLAPRTKRDRSLESVLMKLMDQGPILGADLQGSIRLNITILASFASALGHVWVEPLVKMLLDASNPEHFVFVQSAFRDAVSVARPDNKIDAMLFERLSFLMVDYEHFVDHGH